LNKRERVLRTLEIEEPDRVPIMEMDIEIPLMEAITGRKFQAATSLQTPVNANRDMERKRVDIKADCYNKIGFDVFTMDLSAPEDWEPLVNPDGTIVDLWGRVLRLDKQSKAWVPYTTVFNVPEDYDEFRPLNPNDTGWTFAVEYSRRIIGEDMALAAFIRDPFAHAWEMFTPMKFVTWMYQRPGFIKRVLNQLTDFNVEIIKQIAEADVDFILSGGDYCEKKGPMVPITFFHKVIFPNLKRQVTTSHKKGMKFIKHTDGNIIPLLDDMAEIVDGVHSLDPSAGVDISKVKAEYGERLILMGNISVDNLANKSRLEIVDETKTCIRSTSPGGGHVLTSSNSWAAGANLENCMTMVETGKKYGVYPIRI